MCVSPELQSGHLVFLLNHYNRHFIWKKCPQLILQFTSSSRQIEQSIFSLASTTFYSFFLTESDCKVVLKLKEFATLLEVETSSTFGSCFFLKCFLMPRTVKREIKKHKVVQTMTTIIVSLSIPKHSEIISSLNSELD